jgi:hypothetical protein
MKEAAHLLRLAAILLAGVILFAIARQTIVPAGFGQYGHYRAGALAEIRARPVTYAGRQACWTCHDEVLQVLTKSKHAKIGCEACHGPQARHADADDPSALKPVRPNTATLCAKCHEQILARPKSIPQVVTAEHSGGEPCKSCHQPHSPSMGG